MNGDSGSVNTDSGNARKVFTFNRNLCSHSPEYAVKFCDKKSYADDLVQGRVYFSRLSETEFFRTD